MKSSFAISRWKRHRVAIVAGSLAILLVGVTYLRSMTIAEREERWQTLTRQIAVMDSNVRHAHGLQDQVEQLEKALQEMEKKLFAPDARALNTNFFYQLERDTNIRVLQARQGAYNPGSSSSHFSMLEFVLVVEGDFAALLGFLYKLHSVDAFIAPSSWEIQSTSRRGSAADNNLFTLSLTVRVLARKAA